jgi:predicted lipoprotein with Yx(FWY)xxD motif
LTGAVSTFQRADGTFQVTFNGHPLYFFSQDMSSGDSHGASISTPFGTFSVVTP